MKKGKKINTLLQIATASLLVWLAYSLYLTIVTDNTGFEDKELWDWLELLIVPSALGIGAYWLNKVEREAEQKIASMQQAEERRQAGQREKIDREIADENLKEDRKLAEERAATAREIAQQNLEEDRKLAEERAKIDREIADERQFQTTLETYFDRMSDLLFARNLRASNEGDEVRIVARTRTLATLRNLDNKRKGQVLRFLYESNLIGLENVVDLTGADLEEVVLTHANFSQANLKGVRLMNADLSYINLSGANLEEVNLSQANLTEANLSQANMIEANLSDANLAWAKLIEADLTKADMRRSDLRNSELSNAILNQAKLNHAELRTANLDNAQLIQTDLTAANLVGAIVDSVQLLHAFSLANAIMPDGTRYEDWVKKNT